MKACRCGAKVFDDMKRCPVCMYNFKVDRTGPSIELRINGELIPSEKIERIEVDGREVWRQG